jgi:hypothetical protein
MLEIDWSRLFVPSGSLAEIFQRKASHWKSYGAGAHAAARWRVRTSPKMK